MSDKELNEMIDWCRKKISNLPYNYSGKRKEGYKDAMLQVMSYLHSKKGGEEACNIETDMNAVKCKECEYLMFSDMYGECSKNYKGIVSPNDSCGKGKLKGGEG